MQLLCLLKTQNKNQVVISDISSHIQSETSQKRRAESAGTFIIASEILKPRISHSRESRLSKMLLVLIKSTCEDFTYIFAWCRTCRPFPGLRTTSFGVLPVVTSCRNTTAVMVFYQSLDSHADPSGSVRWPAHYIQVCRREIQRNKRYITLLGHGTVRETSVYKMGKV